MPDFNPLITERFYSPNTVRRNPSSESRPGNEQPQQVNRVPQNSTTNRVVRISDSTLSNAAESLRTAPDDQRSSGNQPPINQYQLNQQLLRREELDGLVGVDLFA